MADEYGHKLRSFTLRMEDELRTKLEDTAKANGRTLTAEINYRLEQSFSGSTADETLEDIREKLESIYRLVQDSP